MAKAGESRVIIDLTCPDCGGRVYTTEKNKRNDPRRLELKKYCPSCRAHRLFKEAK